MCPFPKLRPLAPEATWAPGLGGAGHAPRGVEEGRPEPKVSERHRAQPRGRESVSAARPRHRTSPWVWRCGRRRLHGAFADRPPALREGREARSAGKEARPRVPLPPPGERPPRPFVPAAVSPRCLFVSLPVSPCVFSSAFPPGPSPAWPCQPLTPPLRAAPPLPPDAPPSPSVSAGLAVGSALPRSPGSRWSRGAEW